jgi:hypothetical protein
MIARKHPSRPQLDAAAYHFEVLERLELGIAGGNRRRSRRPVDRCCYLPREVFFGRLGFAGAFFTVWASDFGRFLPAMSDSFPVDCSQAHPTEVAPCAVVGFLLRGQRWSLRFAGDRSAQPRGTSADRAWSSAERAGSSRAFALLAGGAAGAPATDFVARR